MDNGGFVMAAYGVTAALVGLYAWRLARRLGVPVLTAAGRMRGFAMMPVAEKCMPPFIACGESSLPVSTPNT